MNGNVTDWLTLIGAIMAIQGTIIGAVWYMSIWLEGKFSTIRNLVYSKAEELAEDITEKLEYHEKHDDSRFGRVHDEIGNVRNDIWELRVRNAAKDSNSILPPKRVEVAKEDQN